MHTDLTSGIIDSSAGSVRAGKARPALLLFFLSPVVGELLSGSTLPVEYLTNPFILVIHLILYGGGAIIIRELALRWGKGWPTIFLLGAAYGIVEEALLCKSFFDPSYGDVQHFAYYGRWLGVQWVWAIGMTIYHIFISISIPILLTELAFPRQRNEPWVARRGFNILAVLLTVEVFFFYFKVSMPGPGVYLPSPIHLVITLAVIYLLGYLAKRVPKRVSPIPLSATSAPHPVILTFTAVLSVAALYAVPGGFSSAHAHPVFAFAATGVLAYLVIRMLAGWSGSNSAWPGRYRRVMQVLVYGVLISLAVGLSLGSIALLKVLALPIIAAIVVLTILAFRKIRTVLEVSIPWSDAHALALAIGGLVPFIVGGIARETGAVLGQGMGWGMSIVSAAFIVFLGRLTDVSKGWRFSNGPHTMNCKDAKDAEIL